MHLRTRTQVIMPPPLLASFDSDGPNPNSTPDAVCLLIAADAHQRQLLMLVILVNGLIRPYFLPFHCDQPLGLAPNPAFDGKFFAYDGELIHGQGILIELPHILFNLMAQVQVPSVPQIQAHLAIDPATDAKMGPLSLETRTHQ